MQNNNNNNTILQNLSNYNTLLELSFQNLESKEILRIGKTNKQFNQVLENPLCWKYATVDMHTNKKKTFKKMSIDNTQYCSSIPRLNLFIDHFIVGRKKKNKRKELIINRFLSLFPRLEHANIDIWSSRYQITTLNIKSIYLKYFRLHYSKDYVEYNSFCIKSDVFLNCFQQNQLQQCILSGLYIESLCFLTLLNSTLLRLELTNIKIRQDDFLFITELKKLETLILDVILNDPFLLEAKNLTKDEKKEISKVDELFPAHKLTSLKHLTLLNYSIVLFPFFSKYRNANDASCLMKLEYLEINKFNKQIPSPNLNLLKRKEFMYLKELYLHNSSFSKQTSFIFLKSLIQLEKFYLKGTFGQQENVISDLFSYFSSGSQKTLTEVELYSSQPRFSILKINKEIASKFIKLSNIRIIGFKFDENNSSFRNLCLFPALSCLELNICKADLDEWKQITISNPPFKTLKFSTQKICNESGFYRFLENVSFLETIELVDFSIDERSKCCDSYISPFYDYSDKIIDFCGNPNNLLERLKTNQIYYRRSRLYL